MIIQSTKDIDTVFAIARTTIELMLQSGKVVSVDVCEKKSKRSLGQNSYYWLHNGWVADCLNDAGCTYGEFELPFTPDTIHEIQKKVFGVKTTTKMTWQEFKDYIFRITVFWQERTNGEYQPKELPDSWLSAHGYTKEYMRG